MWGLTMSDYKDLENELREKTQEREIHNHGLMLKGKADGLIIKTNAAEGKTDNPSDPKNKEKKEKDAAFYRNLLKESADYWQAQMVKIDKQLKVGQKLRELYKDGELDFDNHEHIALMLEYGIAEGDLNTNGEKAFDKRNEELKKDRTEAEQYFSKSRSLDKQLEQNPDDQTLLKEAGTFIKTNKAFDLGKFDGEEINEFKNSNLVAIEPSFGSAAKEVAPEGNIAFKSIKPDFNTAVAAAPQNDGNASTLRTTPTEQTYKI